MKDQSIWNPLVIGRCGAADLQQFIHTFYGRYDVAMEIEIILLLGRPESLEIRFIPNFEKPFGILGTP
jgi:hypothetical protein